METPLGSVAVPSHLSKRLIPHHDPLRSHRSSNSGAGGLWLVRTAFTTHVLHDLQFALHRSGVKGHAQRAKIGMQQTP